MNSHRVFGVSIKAVVTKSPPRYGSADMVKEEPGGNDQRWDKALPSSALRFHVWA